MKLPEIKPVIPVCTDVDYDNHIIFFDNNTAMILDGKGPEVVKKLKALEIIKEYELDMKVIIYCIEKNIDYAEYVERELWVEAQDKSPMEPMPQEKFDLLKEVLK